MAISCASCYYWAFFVFVITYCFLNPTGNCLRHHHPRDKHVALFIFGDSLLDAGNNNYINTMNEFKANYWPFGESYFNPPSGRFTDGRTIADFIAEHAKLPMSRPYLEPGNHDFTYGANFASAGAGALAETFQRLVIGLKKQLSYFNVVKKQLRQKLGDNEAGQLISNAVYLISVGANDYFSPGRTNDSSFASFTATQYKNMVIGNITTAIKEIFDKGGRKFAVIPLPNLGCSPSNRVQQPNNICSKEITSLSKAHNRALSEALEMLEKQLKGFMYSQIDYYAAASERMNNPSKYGFKDGETACCGTGPLRGLDSCGGKRAVKDYELCDNASEYFFFDCYHPTEAACRQFADLFWHGPLDVTGPYNLKTLFGGESSWTFSLSEELWKVNTIAEDI